MTEQPDSDVGDRQPLRFGRSFNPAFWYGVLGFAVLVATFWVPVATAHRTARVEERGDALAAALLREGMALAPFDLTDPFTREVLSARVAARATAAGVYCEDLELVPGDLAGEGSAAVTLRNKHYVLQLRPSPRADEAVAGAADDQLRWPLEALAWPRYENGPAHTVYFYPEDAPAAFTRNLQFGYFGLDPAHWPLPGRTHRRPDNQRERDYRDFDDERWILHTAPFL